MRKKRVVALLVMLMLVCSITALVIPAGCWPCESTCGSLSGWHVIGTGYCAEQRFDRCLDNECVRYVPQYDDCMVCCRWETWQSPTYETCQELYWNSEICTDW